MLTNPLLEAEDYATLLRALQLTEGFGLFFVVCSPMQADILTQQIKQDIPYEKIQALNLENPIENIYQALEDPVYHHADVVLIQGIEKSLVEYIRPGQGGRGNYYKEDSVPRILGHLNLQRERFRDTFPNLRFVFLLPRFALNYFILRAPDFYDWRSGSFEFSTEKNLLARASLNLLQEAQQDLSALTATERKEKIFEVQTLLEETHQSEAHKTDLYRRYIDLLLADKQWEVAAESCDALLQVVPKDTNVMVDAAISLYQLGQHQEALKKLEHAFTVIPDLIDDPNLLRLQAGILFDAKRADDAISVMGRLLKLDPKESGNYALRGFIYASMQRHEKALASFNKALKLNPELDLWEMQGDTLIHLKRYQKAILSYDKALEKHPDHYAIRMKKSYALLISKKYEAAADCFQAVIEQAPSEAFAWFFKGKSLQRLKRYDDALMHYEKAIQINPKQTDFYAARSDVLSDLGRYEEAIVAFERVAQASEDEFTTWGDKADQLYDSVITGEKIGESEKIGRYTICQVKEDLDKNTENKLNEAILSYNHQVNLRRGECFPYTSRGSAYQHLNKNEEALKDFHQAYELNLKAYDALFCKAQMLFELNRFNESLNDLDILTEQAPDFLQGWLLKNHVLFQLERYTDTITSCYDAVSAGHKHAKIFELLGISQFHLNYNQDALESYQKAADLDPNRPSIWLVQAVIFALLEKKSKMFSALKKMIRYHPDKFEAWEKQGQVLSGFHYDKEALVSFQRLIDLDSTRYQGWMGQGIAYFNLQQYTDAEMQYEKAITRLPDNVEPDAKAELFYHYAKTLAKLKQVDKTSETLNQALALNPENAGYLYQKACFYSQWQQPEPALDALKQAVGLDNKYYETLKKDKDMDPIRDHPDFQNLLQQQPKDTNEDQKQTISHLLNKQLGFDEKSLSPVSAAASMSFSPRIDIHHEHAKTQ